MDTNVTKEQLDELLKAQAELRKMLDKGEAEKQDVIRKDEIAKAVNDIMAKAHPVAPKMVFGKEAKEGEKRVMFSEFLRMVKINHPEIVKAVMNETSDAQGGFTVPTEYIDTILGSLNNIATVPAKCTVISQNALSAKIPKWLTGVQIAWVDEDAAKPLTTPTFTQVVMTLKKMAAIIPMTDELLDDSVLDLSGLTEAAVGEGMGLEIERVALVGSIAAGDKFNGIVNSSPNVVAQAGLNLAWDDIVDMINHSLMLEKYHQGSEIWLNRSVLSLIMKMKDGNNRPLWDIGIPSAGVPSNICGIKYNLTDQIPQITPTVTSSIIYGNMKNVFLGNPKKNAGITVAVSNSAVAPSTGSLTQNAFLQDETWFRFVKRCSITVTVAKAFTVITGVK